MRSVDHDKDQVELVYELNQLFLSFLSNRVQRGLDCLGLSGAARDALRTAPQAVLEELGRFPRSLFRVQFDLRSNHRVMVNEDDSAVYFRQALQLGLIYNVWHVCRSNTYHARLYFGLSNAEVLKLRTTPLKELHHLATCAELVVCAFAHADWLWHELLTETRPEHRRQLALIGLQPTLPSTRRLMGNLDRRFSL